MDEVLYPDMRAREQLWRASAEAPAGRKFAIMAHPEAPGEEDRPRSLVPDRRPESRGRD